MTRDERGSATPTAWPDAGAVPSLPRRLVQAVAMKRGRLGWESSVAAFGGASGPPRVLVRVDEFPHARAFDSAGDFGTDRFKRFHAVLAEAGVPYLLAVTPRVSRDYLDPEVDEWRSLDGGELAQFEQLKRDGVAFGLHGLDHRTRHRSPRRHSEFCGLGVEAAAERIDTARASYDEIGVETPVFVPPFNRFDASQYALLAKRFEVVCAGPESVRLLGFSPTPAWRGDSVYLPSYAPLYGRAAEAVVEVERMAAAEEGLWAPLTLHWGWELEDEFAALRRLCRRLGGLAYEWKDFLASARLSRSATTTRSSRSSPRWG